MDSKPAQAGSSDERARQIAEERKRLLESMRQDVQKFNEMIANKRTDDKPKK